MYRHRVFYESLDATRAALLWICANIDNVEDEDTAEGDDDGANDECFFKTPKKLDDYDQGWIVRRTKAIGYSFNAEDY